MKHGMRRRDFVGTTAVAAARPALAVEERRPPLVLWYRRPAMQWVEASRILGARWSSESLSPAW